MKLTSILKLIGSAAFVAALTTACASEGPPDEQDTTEEGETTPVDDDSAQQEEDSTQATETDEQNDSDVELDDLYTDDLHDLDIPKPGNATASVGGVELAIDHVDCLDPDEIPTSFQATIEGEDDQGTPASISLTRSVNPEADERQETEEVTISLTVEDQETGETTFPSSMLYQTVDDWQRSWKDGEGELPIIRTDGERLTAIGVAEANELHLKEGAIEGPFEIALHCD